MKDWQWTVTFSVLILEKISFYYWLLLKGYQSKKHALTWKKNSSELLSLGALVTLKVSLAISVWYLRIINWAFSYLNDFWGIRDSRLGTVRQLHECLYNAELPSTPA